MIKSLFDENDGEIPVEIEKINSPEVPIKYVTEPEESISPETFSSPNAETVYQNEPQNDERQVSENLSPFSQETSNVEEVKPDINFVFSDSLKPDVINEFPKQERNEPEMFQMHTKSESTAETARKSGLAMSAAIALFGSVVFLLIIGWFADLLLGTSPWGIVGGIVLGSVIGFVQFFRTTSQIIKNED